MPEAEDKLKVALREAARKQVLKAKKAPSPADPVPKTPGPIAPEKKPAAQKPEIQSAAAPKKDGKKEDIFDIIKSVLITWWDFIKKDYRAYYIDLLKVYLARIVAGFAFVFLMCLLGAIAYFGIVALNLAQYWLPLLIIGVLAFIIIEILSMAVLASIGLSAIPMTAARLEGNTLSLRNAFTKIKGKVLRFVLLNAGIWLVLCIPAMIIFALPFLSYLVMPASDAAIISIIGVMLSYLVVWAYLLVVILLYAFFLQFWQYGFLIQGLGVRESLKRSFRLVRSRPLDVLIFDIVYIVLLFAASVPLMIFFFIGYIALIFLQLLLILVPFVGLAIFLLALFLMILLMALFTVLSQMVSVPVMYLFWKRIKG